MALSLEEFTKIVNDDTLLFTESDLLKYPTNEQISHYKQSHLHYTGPYVKLWTLYFEIIEHLVGKQFSGTQEEEIVMKMSMSASLWKSNESHDPKYLSLLFTIISNLVNGNMGTIMPFNKEWEMLLNYTSMCLPTQINNMLADKEKSRIFGRTNIRNMPKQNRDMMEIMIKNENM
jgi:hypothetical protein